MGYPGDALTYKSRCQLSTTERWRDLVHEVLDTGEKVVSRGFTCLECLGVKIVVDMQLPVVLSRERKLGYRFMCAEAAWLLSGDNKVATIAPFSKRIASFSDDGIIFFGAYGPRILPQLAYVVKTLAEDQGSRQVVAAIWRENPPKSKDVPCSLSVQWLIRDNKLHCMLNMRSSDIWLGVPYDLFNFSMLSLYLLKKLPPGLALGDLHLYAGSSHLYEENLSWATEVAGSNEVILAPFDLAVVHAAPAEKLAGTLWNLARQKENDNV
ncbi:MAG: thymidylate synthase [Dehalococcoidia bacterium]